MENQCLTCSKRFSNSAALIAHTGTNDPALHRRYGCSGCNQRFCSKVAIEQHRHKLKHHDAPVHNAPVHKTPVYKIPVTFSCDVCQKSFGSKQAVAQHKSSHVKNVAPTHAVVVSIAAAESNRENGTPSQTEPHTPRSSSSSSSSSRNNNNNYTEQEFSEYENIWATRHPVELDDDQDWILCDANCRWCGHCADGVDMDFD